MSGGLIITVLMLLALQWSYPLLLTVRFSFDAAWCQSSAASASLVSSNWDRHLRTPCPRNVTIADLLASTQKRWPVCNQRRKPHPRHPYLLCEHMRLFRGGPRRL